LPAAERAPRYQACLDAERAKLACEQVTAVSEGFDSCIDALGATSCDTFLLSSASGMPALPSDCDGVVELGPQSEK
jgi:hypothetical protein